MEPTVRRWRPERPTDLRLTLGPLWRGLHDRTMAVDRVGPTWRTVWRTAHTPDGPVTLRVQPAGDQIEAGAVGPGTEWALDQAPALLGREDEGPSAALLLHPILGPAARRFDGLRLGRTDRAWETLIPVVFEQKVTGLQARRSLGALLRAIGTPAPRHPDWPSLLVAPTPAAVEGTPSHVFRTVGVEGKRADTLRRAASYAHRIERLGSLAPDVAQRAIRVLPGIGPWTAAEVAARAWGDRDAVSVGDFHLKNTVSWALAREPRGTDERMLELLAPFAGDRARVVRLIELTGDSPPAYGARLTIQTYPEHPDVAPRLRRR